MPFIHTVLGYEVFDSTKVTTELVEGDDLTKQFHWMEGLLVGLIPAPRRKLPRVMLYAIALLQETYARLTGKPVLLSLATVNNMAKDYGRRFSADKIRREFGLGFRPMEETLADEVRWHRQRWAESSSLSALGRLV